MLLKTKFSLTCLLLLLTAINGFYGHFMMKGLMQSASLAMMMRPRLLPIPVPVPAGMMSSMISGFRSMFDEPQQEIIVVQKPRRKQRIIVVQDENQCCNDW